MTAFKQFKLHGVGTLDVVKVAASGAKARFTAERDTFNLAATRTLKFSIAKVKITAINGFVYVFINHITDFNPKVDNVTKMVSQDSL